MALGAKILVKVDGGGRTRSAPTVRGTPTLPRPSHSTQKRPAKAQHVLTPSAQAPPAHAPLASGGQVARRQESRRHVVRLHNGGAAQTRSPEAGPGNVASRPGRWPTTAIEPAACKPTRPPDATVRSRARRPGLLQGVSSALPSLERAMRSNRRVGAPCPYRGR